MKTIIFIVLMMLTTACMADEIGIPFSCWPLQLQQEFGKLGIKLDLTANERTFDSWGYIDSKGSSYSLFTYKAAKPEDFELIKDITHKIELETRAK